MLFIILILFVSDLEESGGGLLPQYKVIIGKAKKFFLLN